MTKKALPLCPFMHLVVAPAFPHCQAPRSQSTNTNLKSVFGKAVREGTKTPKGMQRLTVPLFFAANNVTIKKRFDLLKVAQRQQARLAGLYYDALKIDA